MSDGFFEELQRAIARVALEAGKVVKEVEVVVGVDAAYHENLMVAAAVAWDVGSREVISESFHICEPPHPYVPGLLFLREGPALLEAVKRIKHRWDLLMVDGHGLLHPRRAGLAVILGFILDMPSLGVAKSLLVGVEGEGEEMGPIYLDDKVLGYWFRRNGRRRFYVSPGYRVGVGDVPRIVERVGPGYPEVMRLADRAARERLKRVLEKGD